MEVMVFEKHDFDLIVEHQRQMHNNTARMTFDEQRDYAERFRLLLERAVLMQDGDFR